MTNLDKSIKVSLDYRDQLKNNTKGIDLDILKKHIPFFELIDASKTSIVFVQNICNSDIYYVSERFYDIFGFPQKKSVKINHVWFRKQFHPNDYIINLSGIKMQEFLNSIAVEERKNYKLIHEFRIKNESGKWIRLLVQDFILELDKGGNPWLNMKLCDLSPNQDMSLPGTSICRNLVTGESINLCEVEKKEDVKEISSREKEVLGLIAEGMKSKEIADKLFISANTVNNHRRNVIKKMKVSNSSEAVTQAIKFGII